MGTKIKSWLIPLLIPGKGWHFEELDGEGNVISSRKANPDEYLALNDDPIAAYNERADFELWLRRKILTEAFPDYRPGYWRGAPNPYAMK